MSAKEGMDTIVTHQIVGIHPLGDQKIPSAILPNSLANEKVLLRDDAHAMG